MVDVTNIEVILSVIGDSLRLAHSNGQRWDVTIESLDERGGCDIRIQIQPIKCLEQVT